MALETTELHVDIALSRLRAFSPTQEYPIMRVRVLSPWASPQIMPIA